MPQLDLATFFSQFFWLVIFFLGFYLVLTKETLPRIARTKKFRHKRLVGSETQRTYEDPSSERTPSNPLTHAQKDGLGEGKEKAGETEANLRKGGGSQVFVEKTQALANTVTHRFWESYKNEANQRFETHKATYSTTESSFFAQILRAHKKALRLVLPLVTTPQRVTQYSKRCFFTYAILRLPHSP